MKSRHFLVLLAITGLVASFLLFDSNEERVRSTREPKDNTGNTDLKLLNIPQENENEPISDHQPDRDSLAKSADTESSNLEELLQPIQLPQAKASSWLESKSGDPMLYLEAAAMAAMINKDAELLRNAVEKGRENPKLAYLGATDPIFSSEEQLRYSKQFYLNAPENGLAGFLYAAKLFDSGDLPRAIKILEESKESHLLDDYSLDRQLLIEDAFLSSGIASNAAKLQATFASTKQHLSDILVFARELDGFADPSSTNDTSKLRSLTASMGVRIRKSADAGMIMDQLIGIEIERRTLDGLGDSEASPYESMTVTEAREAIKLKKNEISTTLQKADLETFMAKSPDLLGEFVDKVREVGELEALKWIQEISKP